MTRLSVIGAWSDQKEELVQVVYEDCDTGTIFIESTTESKGTTVVSITGEVSKITNKEFRDVWMDGDYG